MSSFILGHLCCLVPSIYLVVSFLGCSLILVFPLLVGSLMLSLVFPFIINIILTYSFAFVRLIGYYLVHPNYSS